MTAYYLGLDMGSAFSKGVLMKTDRVVTSYACPTGGEIKVTAERIRDEVLLKAGAAKQDILKTVATGYGSKTVFFANVTVTDMSAHAKGVIHLCPSIRTVVDIGDLYSKVFRIDSQGNLQSFLLSGKCAGGSGRALTMIAKVLQLKIEEMGEIALRSTKKVEFSTGCAVFAESEAVSRIAEGVAKEDLLAGFYRALAAQLNALAERLGLEPDYAMVGGGARNAGLVKAMEDLYGFEIVVPPDPHMTAALGAALIAAETVRQEIKVRQ
ncbi:MAG: 2-hydroxyglutaryl-CoA dehydratase [Deltaproteobacteria bacterium]|nr:2-hydroxyglutaryl-CoA dehydratase [Deltaproteobacteria bacterium]